MEHINIEIKGKFDKYAVLTAENGYCFYDVNEEARNYVTQLFTPVIDEAELEKAYIVVQGDAEKLNEELQNENDINA